MLSETETQTAKQPTPLPPVKRRFRLPRGWMAVSILLLLVIAVMTWLWKPWDAGAKASDRTIKVQGTATVKAEPDEYIFYPYYQVTNADKQAALKEITEKSTQIVTELKKLGVADKDIKTDSSGYGNELYAPTGDSRNLYTLSLTVTVNNKTLAQKVQDYLLTTSPSGTVTPEGTFSEAKQKQLEGQARDKAEKDARSKADQSAKNLGFKVNEVKSLEDTGFDNYYYGCRGGLCSGLDAASQSSEKSTKLSIQPGEEEINYSVQVTYYIR